MGAGGRAVESRQSRPALSRSARFGLDFWEALAAIASEAHFRTHARGSTKKQVTATAGSSCAFSHGRHKARGHSAFGRGVAQSISSFATLTEHLGPIRSSILINNTMVGRLAGKNIIVTGAAGYVI